MRVPHLLTIVAVASMLGVSTPARAQCAGFTDVPAGGNCPSVTWVKNRSITLGCTSATLYCPSSPVSRLAMALFMKRLGEVFTPRVLDVEQSGGVLNFSGFSYLCTATPFQATGYRQRAIVEGGLLWGLVSCSSCPQSRQIGVSSVYVVFNMPAICA